jgi:hypothetical protein
MNNVLWGIQIILGIKMMDVSFSHGLRQSKSTMLDAITKMGGSSRPLLYIVSVCTFIGTLGLILPGLMGLSSWVTPVTAAILSIMLLFSIFFHIKSREKPKVFVSVVLFIFAVIIAFGRWILVPF